MRLADPQRTAAQLRYPSPGSSQACVALGGGGGQKMAQACRGLQSVSPGVEGHSWGASGWFSNSPAPQLRSPNPDC